MNWILKPWCELTTDELYDLLALRVEVFVVEQTCPFQDLDGLDRRDGVLHLLGWQDGALVAYARLMAPGVAKSEQVVIGRVVTAPEARGDGLGHRLMQQALQECARLWPGVSIYLGAQAHLQGFYGRHGFTAVGEPYLEDDIPHIGMSSS
ncbi:TPA: GNAT family N-acetyltransferase [Aeromonas dhakensis]|uniref:GNAT family N-acetyltransferase n=1 Tax=Aeromonas TaxID=642 RepID=UPI00034D8BAC|nr:GNAT family N-acetyltransferase [Aeromonas dhakensis]KMK98587.1 acyltransferase [Aeromonas enteropelogenes]ELM3750692.1 GNAT family N-acetyltransferase [Aeromonas dhakensis]MBL0680405.1 GNAT family N-acetyltransferase [Aeromonas dhakensis]MBO2900209.1 GNAT family N-acetyltransferase [Aeromonas dhakensis]MBO2996278.1 GNAT family N-acetyltransferase [Aeromonas dhakensis]